VKRVLHVNHPAHQNPVAELLAPLIVALQKQHSFTHVLAPASTFGKNLIPRVGGLLDVAPISEVMGRLCLVVSVTA
jgi:electron transfer flavoprotein alpha subunit